MDILIKRTDEKHFSKWVNLAYGWNALRNLIFMDNIDLKDLQIII